MQLMHWKFEGSAIVELFYTDCIRKGRVAAISATARKLAIIIWNMVVKKVPYNPRNEYEFLDQKRKKILEMRKLITKLDIQRQTSVFSCKCVTYENVSHNKCKKPNHDTLTRYKETSIIKNGLTGLVLR